MSLGRRRYRRVDDLLAAVDFDADKVTLRFPERDASAVAEAMRSKGYDVHKQTVADDTVEAMFARIELPDPGALWRDVQERFVTAGLWCHRHDAWTDRNVCTARCEIVPVFMSEAGRNHPALRSDQPARQRR